MIVNNTDHLLEDDIGLKPLVTSEEQGSAGKAKRILSGGGGEDMSITAIGSENLSQNLVKENEEEKVKRESIEVGVNGSVEMSGLESGGKKKKKYKKKKFMAEELEGNELNILSETSMDQSERETEELYLKLEKANRDLWLHQSVSSSKKEKDTHMSGEVVKVENVAQGSPEQGVQEADDAGSKRSIADDVAQGSPEQGVEEADDAGTKRSIADDVAQGSPERRVEEADDAGIKWSIADDVAQESNGGDIKENPHLFAGTTEASDREEDVFLSQGKVFHY